MYKVLIADDEEITRKGLVNFIRLSGLELEVIGDASDGRKALDIFTETPTDIVISDIRMPNMDGLELTKGIKTADPSAIVILLSAYDDFKYAQQAVKLGAFDYILKPIDVDVLTAVAQNAIGFIRRNAEKKDRAVPLINENELEFYASDIYKAVSRPQEELLGALKGGDISVLQKLLEEIWEILIAKNASLEFVKRFSAELFSQLVKCMIALQEKPDSLFSDMNPRSSIARADSREKLHHWLNESIARICDTLRSKRNNKQTKLVNEILKYIDENYTDSKLTLSTISERLYFSPNYLSAVFKDSMGIGFLEFLTNYRMEKAKKLLADIKYKVYEISTLAGYSDSHYFSRIFKECTGMTPTEYREKTV